MNHHAKGMRRGIKSRRTATFAKSKIARAPTFKIDPEKFEKLFSDSCQTLLESVNTSACINEFLLAREEGMALGANFHSHIALRGTGLVLGTARTSDRAFFVIGMDSVLHL